MSIKITVHITHTAPKMILLTAMIVFLLTSSAVAGGAPEASEIIRIEWKWQQTLYNNDTEVVPDDPDRYTVTFGPDGKIHLRADCNRGGGRYSVDGKNIIIELAHTTRAMCPPDSLEQTFIKNLNAARIYFLQQGNLYLDLKYDTGTMKFGD